MLIAPRLRSFLFLLAIMLVAVFFRFYKLDSIPPGLYPDVAINGNDALRSLQTGDYQLFYPENNGREGLIMWLDAASLYLLGISPTALKIPAAVFGTLTVLGVYLLARQLFDPTSPGASTGNGKRREGIALLSSFLVAVSFWHVNFSRIGFRAIMVPFFLVFAFYFLDKGFKTKKFLWVVLSGIFFGLGFYAYISFRLAVPLLFCVLGLWLIIYLKQKDVVRFVRLSAAMLLTTFVVALPIGIYFLFQPQDFLGRASQTSVFSQPNPLLALAESFVLHLGMFNIYGDSNWRHNYAGAPELFWPVGILFVIGIGYAFAQLISLTKKREFGLEFNSYGLLFLWFFFLLLPGVLTSEGIPHALRVIGVIPAVFIFCGIGGAAAYCWLRSRFSRIAVMLLAAVFIASAAIGGYHEYFAAWAKNSNVQGAFTVPYLNVANLVLDLREAGYQTTVVVNEGGVSVPYPDGISMPAQTVIFAETAHCYKSGCLLGKTWYSPHATYLKPGQLGQIISGQKTAVVPMRDDQAIFDRLSQMFPHGQVEEQDGIRYFEIE